MNSGNAKTICLIVDDLTFRGGAHIATLALAEELVTLGTTVDVATMSDESAIDSLKGGASGIKRIKPKAGFIGRVLRFVGMSAGGVWPVCQFEHAGELRRWLESHDTVCCVSECSPLRWLTASLGGSCRKVQMIHTDYVGWRQYSPDAHRVTRLDRFLYSKMDCVAVVGKKNAERMKALLSGLADKIVPFYNIIKDGVKTSFGGIETECSSGRFKIATIGRPNWGPPKKTEASIEVAAELKRRGCDFDWIVYGNGPGDQVSRLKNYARSLCVEDCFCFAGFTQDVGTVLRAADVMALFSAYEGCANAVYESLLCGTPVLATDVGCAREQIKDNVTGRVLDMDVHGIADAIESLIKDRNIVRQWKKNLAGYEYDNAKALKGLMEVLGVGLK